jgi:hypothetical protein
MTATQITQKKFQRIDVDALERLMQVDIEPESTKGGILGFIKSLVDRFIL